MSVDVWGQAPLVLLFGGGVQSTAMAVLAAEEGWPVAAAVHADTGCESTSTTETMAALERGLPYPVLTVPTELTETLMAGRCVIPVWTTGDGQLRRACTRDYKIRPVRRELRRRWPRGVTVAMGISVEEAGRMRAGFAYPLIDERLDRAACERVCCQAGINARPSSCVCCPYHSDVRWAALSISDQRRAEEIDCAIRESRGVREACWLHRSRRPLAQCWDDLRRQPALPGMEGIS